MYFRPVRESKKRHEVKMNIAVKHHSLGELPLKTTADVYEVAAI
ncbi:hypothetical protein RS3R6_39420 [Pseudomonas atacamensis]|uniref:Integrase n=1 Tax=Pseudomonas atacamensis TaxID=2565368 RepID=A0ABQ5PP14_9PSED|nr:hypothetical protein RS3R1_43610 [Pseudomonas atacamensis]GLH55760.1 hypothetical protein RS3R6_39420 [Pseudomonas atacamensis]